MSMFKVIGGIFENERHVQVLRPINADDLDWQTVKGDHDTGSFLRVTASFKPKVFTEVKAAFPKDNSWRQGREHAETIESLHRNDFSSGETMRAEFRGCSGEEARKRKVAKVRPEFMKALEASVPEFMQRLVNGLNKNIQFLVTKVNDSYRGAHVQALTNQPWSELDEKAGVVGKLAEIKAARETISRLHAEVDAARNAKALEMLEADGWVVTAGDKDYVMPPEVVAEVSSWYKEGKAFKSRMMFSA